MTDVTAEEREGLALLISGFSEPPDDNFSGLHGRRTIP